MACKELVGAAANAFFFIVCGKIFLSGNQCGFIHHLDSLQLLNVTRKQGKPRDVISIEQRKFLTHAIVCVFVCVGVFL